MTYKKVGEFPTNARIKIDYSSGEPKIDFEYPENERQVKNLYKSSGVMLPAMVATVVMMMILFFLYFQLGPPVTYPKNCTGTVLTNNVTLDTTGINLFCDNLTKYYWFHYDKDITLHGSWYAPENNTQILYLFGLSILFIFLYLGGIFVFGKIFAFFVRKTKKGLVLYPEWNKRIHNKHWEAKFTECPDNLIIELPLFSNIYMDYDAEEEFSDYLESVEIKEHDFTYYPTKGFRFFRHRRKERKGEKNVYLWKAIFKFKKKPTKGYLKINWT